MTFFAVIDTNVIVSALRASHSDSATVRVMNAVFDGKVVPLYTGAIIDEYQDVLHRPRLKLNPEKCDFAISFIRDRGQELSPLPCGLNLPDEDDRVFYEVALAGQADSAKLVTGNQKHFPNEPFVVTPAQFCEIVGI